jgi:hypothetical protein
MSFDQAITVAIAEIEASIATYHARGEVPPGYLTSQWADLKSRYFGGGTPVGQPQPQTRQDFTEFADTWTVTTPDILYPHVSVTVTEMKGVVLNSPLKNVVTQLDVSPNTAVIQFFKGGLPIEVKGYVLCV